MARVEKSQSALPREANDAVHCGKRRAPLVPAPALGAGRADGEKENSQEALYAAAAAAAAFGKGAPTHELAVRAAVVPDAEEGSDRRVPDMFPLSDGEEKAPDAEDAGHAAKKHGSGEDALEASGSGNGFLPLTGSSGDEGAVAGRRQPPEKKRRKNPGREADARVPGAGTAARAAPPAPPPSLAEDLDLERRIRSAAHGGCSSFTAGVSGAAHHGLGHAVRPPAHKPSKPSPPNRPDDKDGHYEYELGENLTSRYKIMSKLGEGTFGRVIECWDRERKEYCAIKIIRNVRKYRNAAMMELEVLKKLRANDPGDTRHCVRLLHWFEYRNHICMVFERLGLSLYDFLLKNHYAPFDVEQVREFAFQLLDSVGYVHDLDLVHTDLKPENILLRALEYFKVPLPDSKHYRRIPKSTEIKLIDFGSAAFIGDRHASLVSTRHYRAPEVILGLGWGHSCDLWSVGCILVELVTGVVLFNTHDNLEHLAMMERILGDIPKALVDAAHESKQTKGFFDNSILNWPQGETTLESRKAVRKLIGLRELLTRVAPAKEAEMLELVDLVQKLMSFEASKRISAGDALNHPFFRNSMWRGRAGAAAAAE